MDKEQAQFILRSFRPDGADASDSDFAEALQLAAEDRELGEWLAKERAADASFSEAMYSVTIPEGLRQHIMMVMQGQAPDDPEAYQEMDNFVMQAMHGMEPPVGLREEILTAMHTQSATESNVVSLTDEKNTNKKPRTTSWLRVAAIAAAVVLGAFLAFQFTSSPRDGGKLASYDVHLEAANFLKSGMKLDVKNQDIVQINHWLGERNLPSPKLLPPGLVKLKKIGCKMIVLPGDEKASLVCFAKDDGGMVHLVIVPNEALQAEDLPEMKNVAEGDCYFCPKSQWNFARWRDGQNTFIMLASKNHKDPKAVLEYF